MLSSGLIILFFRKRFARLILPAFCKRLNLFQAQVRVSKVEEKAIKNEINQDPFSAFAFFSWSEVADDTSGQ